MPKTKQILITITLHSKDAFFIPLLQYSIKEASFFTAIRCIVSLLCILTKELQMCTINGKSAAKIQVCIVQTAERHTQSAYIYQRLCLKSS